MTQGGMATSGSVTVTRRGTITSGEHGLIVGIADGQLSATEIEEAINDDGPTFREQVPQAERADRRVNVLGVFSGNPAGETLQESKQFDVPRHSWSEERAGWQWFVVNDSGASYTTGQIVTFLATHVIQWSA